MLQQTLAAIGRNRRWRRLQYRLIDRGINHLLPAITLRQAQKLPVVISERFPLGRNGQQMGRLFLPGGVPPPSGWPLTLGWHGGGWAMGRPDNLALAAATFARAGLATLLADYRLAPKHRWPAQYEDVQAAVGWVHDQNQYPLDVARLAVFGDSAGGHLAASALTRNATAFRAGVLFYGVFDYVRLARGNLPLINDMLRALFGRDCRDPAVLENASPAFHIPANGPPLLLLVGDRDPLLRQSQRFLESWQKAGNYAELKVYPGRYHGFVNVPGGAARDLSLEDATGFLTDQLGR